jgi:hypothetical protein
MHPVVVLYDANVTLSGERAGFLPISYLKTLQEAPGTGRYCNQEITRKGA